MAPKRLRLESRPEDEDGGEDDSDSDDESSTKAQYFGYVKQALYFVTEMERFAPPRKRPRTIIKNYRLVNLRSTTPEELYQRKVKIRFFFYFPLLCKYLRPIIRYSHSQLECHTQANLFLEMYIQISTGCGACYIDLKCPSSRICFGLVGLMSINFVFTSAAYPYLYNIYKQQVMYHEWQLKVSAD